MYMYIFVVVSGLAYVDYVCAVCTRNIYTLNKLEFFGREKTHCYIMFLHLEHCCPDSHTHTT